MKPSRKKFVRYTFPIVFAVGIFPIRSVPSLAGGIKCSSLQQNFSVQHCQVERIYETTEIRNSIVVWIVQAKCSNGIAQSCAAAAVHAIDLRVIVV